MQARVLLINEVSVFKDLFIHIYLCLYLVSLLLQSLLKKQNITIV